MCGIVGFWADHRFDGRPASEIATRMADALKHRGPDDAGVWTEDQRGVAFGHRRLAIIDVSSAGHQPMSSAGGRYVITFNGEIYNHRALRAAVEAAGLAPAWRGHSDTETLLAAISGWGLAAALERCVGMFALALWDRESCTLQLARDRLGEKPLYYGWVGGSLVFGSELKAFHRFPGFTRTVNRDVLALYTQFGNVPAPYAIFEGVSKLAPAAILSLDAEGLRSKRPVLSTYWSFLEAARRGLSDPLLNEQEALRALEAQLRVAVASTMESDVPLGAFLSGGVDSSLIAALMQAQSPRPVQTFTVGFEEADYDESPFAKAVAAHLGTEHHEVRLRAEDARAVISDIPVIYDEPFADSSQIATHLICRYARSHVKVALSGDGGDELFGGYNRYLWSRRVWSVWSRFPAPLRRAAAGTLGRIPTVAFDRIASVLGADSLVSHVGTKAHKLLQRLGSMGSVEDMHRRLLTEWPSHSALVLGAKALPSLLTQKPVARDGQELEDLMMMLDTVTYLPDDVLTKVDRAAMAVGLETRVPFLDHHLVEFAWRLPLEMKIRHGQGKWALRQILYKYVPQHLIERPKSGFAVPLGAWLRGPLRDWAEALLSADRLAREGYFDPKQVRAVWAQHLKGRQEWTERLWYVLTFQSWLEKNT